MIQLEYTMSDTDQIRENILAILKAGIEQALEDAACSIALRIREAKQALDNPEVTFSIWHDNDKEA